MWCALLCLSACTLVKTWRSSVDNFEDDDVPLRSLLDITRDQLHLFPGAFAEERLPAHESLPVSGLRVGMAEEQRGSTLSCTPIFVFWPCIVVSRSLSLSLSLSSTRSFHVLYGQTWTHPLAQPQPKVYTFLDFPVPHVNSNVAVVPRVSVRCLLGWQDRRGDFDGRA